ncbi:hypothetical protein ChUKH1_16965 [Cryptosporidium hominis]|uniref:ARID domain-containing protein n=1 Tax=Cryptosporidium hominis TaxID=237895 RepID=A0ABX5BCM1_CRYHO|nr:hypothetical protein [Cryptosporidium hominis TU502]OLQ18407.1 hypothetical protein ChTU502y2012_409g0460 [Cryptosporidium hominis]PPA65424.1 hypothetical protein ChUKH1_16965 [Cryptosporidium hominis]PPS95371.1 Uncharacterized protein GY17_00002763 [Cryptosporidium hominis]|eukprot:PPS95371.1 Uncharacterized protein GY17_00002763 [Cryptosporidium hominis]
MLVIKEEDYNSLWAELQWDGEKFDKVMGYFRKYAGLEEGLSREKLSKLLLDLGKSCYTIRGGVSSMTERGDLCWIMSGTDMLSGSQFMCLAGLLDNSTPHSTSSPAGLLRLEMIFMYYDKGNKGYWNMYDWELLMRDIQYPAKNGEKLVPYPLGADQYINFETLKKLVDTRRLRGTSQLLRVSFDSENPEKKANIEIIKDSNITDKKVDCENLISNVNKPLNDNNTFSLKEGNVEYIKLSEKTTYSPIIQSRGKPDEKFSSNVNTHKLQVFSPRKKVAEKKSPSKKRLQKQNSGVHEGFNASQDTLSPRPLTSRGTFVDYNTKSSAYQDGVSSYMSRIPVVTNALDSNYTPRLAFRGSVAPNSYYTVNDGRQFIANQVTPSVVPNAIQHIPYQIPVNVPYQQMPIQQFMRPTSNYISPHIAAQINKGIMEPGSSGSPMMNSSNVRADDRSGMQNFNKFQTFGQSLQNMGQSIISMIPKVFSVPNITVGAGNYSYVSQDDIQKRGSKSLNDGVVNPHFQSSPKSIINTNEQPDTNSIYGSTKKASDNSNFNMGGETMSNGMMLPNFHSTYSNENYPMSIDLSKLNAVTLPVIPESGSNFNSYQVGNSGGEIVIKESANEVEDVKLNKIISHEIKSEIEIGTKKPIKIEEVDHFFTFMEQLLYNEIVGSAGLFDKVLEGHESNFQLSDKEEILIGPLMQLTTMDQFVLTFALNCVVSHQNSGNSYNQNEGVLGNGVSIDVVGEKINSLIDLFHRIYRIMYQDLRNEVERNGDAILSSNSIDDQQKVQDKDPFVGYGFLPYIVKMVWEKVRAALEGDLDVIETIKDICVVYYHYLLESNGSFATENNSEESSQVLKCSSIEEMIEIVRQRYVVAMKMLSLNNSAKTNSAEAKKIKNQASVVRQEPMPDPSISKISQAPHSLPKPQTCIDYSHLQNKGRSIGQIQNQIRYENQLRGENFNLILKEVNKSVFVPVAKSRVNNSSPHYPLMTATSSPNYNLIQQENIARDTEKKVVVGGNSSRRSLNLDSGESNPNVIPCVLQESMIDTENSSQHHHNKILNHQESVVSKGDNMMGGASSIMSFTSSANRNYSYINNTNNGKAPANIASYCPAEHTLTDKMPETRLERKSRIPSRIL